MTNTQSGSRSPSSIGVAAAIAGAVVLLLIGALLLALGLDRAEKVLSIVGVVAGMAGVALTVHGLFRHQAGAAAAAQEAAAAAQPGPGGLYVGRDMRVGHNVNTGGILAVGGILATLYIVLGAAGVVRSGDAAGLSVDELAGTWGNSSAPIGGNGMPAVEMKDTVLTVTRDHAFRLSYGATGGAMSLDTTCTGAVEAGTDHYELLSTEGNCPSGLTARPAGGGRYLTVAVGGQPAWTLTRR